MPKFKKKSKLPSSGKVFNDAPEEKPKYPPANCLDCGKDMSDMGTRKWRWTGTKTEGPICNECARTNR